MLAPHLILCRIRLFVPIFTSHSSDMGGNGLLWSFIFLGLSVRIPVGFRRYGRETGTLVVNSLTARDRSSLGDSPSLSQQAVPIGSSGFGRVTIGIFHPPPPPSTLSVLAPYYDDAYQNNRCFWFMGLRYSVVTPVR